jgi:hypothetical protein
VPRAVRPATTLAIISYPATMDSGLEAAAAHFAKLVGPAFALERCQDPSDLVFLAKRWKGRGRRIVRLDLHGHGDGGRFMLGDELLFASDGTGYDLANELGPQLDPGAQLRLLGCNVANEHHPKDPRRFSGKKLLRDLQRLLGRQRRVFGTTDFFGPQHWGPEGLNDVGEALLKGA